jgi:hypothetical protein
MRAQQRAPHLVPGVALRATVEQQPRARHAVLVRRAVQRRGAILGGSVLLRAGVHQQPHALQVALVRRDVQRRDAILRAAAQSGQGEAQARMQRIAAARAHGAWRVLEAAAREQQLRARQVARLRGCVQRRGALLRWRSRAGCVSARAQLPQRSGTRLVCSTRLGAAV